MSATAAVLVPDSRVPETWESSESPLTARALSIAGYLHDAARRTAAGDAVWMTPPPGDGRGPMAMDPHLYSGSLGVAFFLGALGHLLGGTEHRELALAGVAPLRRKITDLTADAERASHNRVAPGGLVGVGSFVYGLVRLAGWTGEPELVADAHRATALLTPERIFADDQLDVMRGTAGTILALLALDEVAPQANSAGRTPLELAWACAEHLLKERVSVDGSPRAWPIEGGTPRTGFAHGAAGTACALMRMYARTGDERLRDAALEGFAFERHLYDPRVRNWWDPRYDTYLQLQSWCFGAPGVALSRLEALGTDADGPELRADLADALDIAVKMADEPVDHLCCGNLGRADVLGSAAHALGDAELLETARAIALRSITRAATEEDFGLIPPGNVPVLRFSLFRGVAGIAYALLRLAHPGALPSPLCME